MALQRRPEDPRPGRPMAGARVNRRRHNPRPSPKGLKMAGQMGNKRVTQKSGKIVAVDAERNLIFIRGSAPGAADGIVLIRKKATH